MTSRVIGKIRRYRSRTFGRQPYRFDLERPIISFTFDDFPKSAVSVGARILEDEGFRATYFVSFGLMGSIAPTGRIFEEEDLHAVSKAEHELGCHTFHHCHAWDTPVRDFVASVGKNRRALERYLPGMKFETLSYPISCPRPAIKRAVSREFLGCRAGEHIPNIGEFDRSAVRSYFLERAGGRMGGVRDLVDQNCRERGWLVFSTHDIAADHTPYGCAPEFFQEVVQYAKNSGSEILPMGAALKRVGCQKNWV